MAAWEEVPTLEEAEREWAEDPAGFESWVRESIDGITWQEHDRRHLHDRDAFLCHSAGSDECRALGHPPRPDESADPAGYERWADEWGHEYGWDDELICPATKYGSACSVCETDDCPHPATNDLWSMPWVTGSTDSESGR